MIFLIEYNRQKGRKIKFERFKDSDRTKAENRRHEIELDLNHRGINHEVVLLEAVREKLIHQTHQRYFKNLRQIVKSVKI